MFEDLEAWQQARHLVNEIYSLTRENSSLSKDFGLTAKCKGLLYQSCRTSGPVKYCDLRLCPPQRKGQIILHWLHAAVARTPSVT